MWKDYWVGKNWYVYGFKIFNFLIFFGIIENEFIVFFCLVIFLDCLVVVLEVYNEVKFLFGLNIIENKIIIYCWELYCLFG